MVRGSTLWFFGTSGRTAGLIVALVGILATVVARQSRHASTAREAMTSLLWALGLLPLFVLLTNLLPFVKPDPGRLTLLFRTLIAFQWTLVFFAAYLVSRLVELAGMKAQRTVCFATKAIAIAIAGIAGFVTWNLYYNFVRFNAAEFAYVKQQLIDNRARIADSNICVIQPGRMQKME